MRSLTLLLAVAVGVCVVAQEGVYRWTDPQGRVHYGSQPPEETSAEPVDLNPGSARTAADTEVFTWKDAQGRIHYGDRPPAEGGAEAFDTETAPLSTIRGGTNP